MAKLFFSYSHEDESLRDQLDVHLATMKRQGVIETWHDRRIVAGDEFDGKISDNLESADIILLLVSPYFLDSKYCHDVEMQRAMEKHEAGSARVIPVILESCDWRFATFGKLLAVPQDGKPISKFANIHDALLEVTNAIREAAGRHDAPTVQPAKASRRSTVMPNLVVESPRSSNLRVKKQFSERERDKFREVSFEYIANFFEGSLTELQSRNPSIETDFKRIDANTFTATIYENGKSKSECAISLSDSFGGNGIVYSSDKSSRGNSHNHILRIVDDGTTLAWTQTITFGSGPVSNGQLTPEGAAEAFWSVLMSPLQR